MKLKDIRIERGYTQAEMAKMAGVRLSTYQRWESGESIPYPSNKRHLAEALGIDISTLFADFVEKQQISDIIVYTIGIPDILNSDLTLRLQALAFSSLSYSDLHEKFLQIMEEFDAMNTENMQYPISRREALSRLAALSLLPSVLIKSSQQELFLRQCAASIAACEMLSQSAEPADLLLAFQCVCQYLSQLQAIAINSSYYRRSALELSAHCAILKTNLAWSCMGDAVAIQYAGEAVQIARDYDDLSLLLSAYSKLSWAYLYDNKPNLALETAKDARSTMEAQKIAHLPVCIRGGTYSTLAVMQARNRQNPDSSLKKAQESDPGDQIIAYMAFTRMHISKEQGEAYLYIAPAKTLAVFEKIIDPTSLILKSPYQTTFSEQERIGILLSMCRASVKTHDMERAIFFWKAVMSGAQQLKSESMFSGALTSYEQLEIVFPHSPQVRELQGLLTHW